MRANQISVNKIKLNEVLDLQIHKKVNEHGKAILSAIIDDSTEKDFMNSVLQNKWLSIQINNENVKKIIFSGIIYNVSVISDSGLRKAVIELVGGTQQMDLMELTKTYQDHDATYRDLMESSSRMSGATFQGMDGLSNPIGRLIVQYEETDWTFVKRLASNINSCIIPFYDRENVEICVGIRKEAGLTSIQTKQYEIKKIVNESYEANKSGTDTMPLAEVYAYFFEHREFIELGAAVNLNGEELYIYSVESFIKGQELVHRYEARDMSGFQCKTYNNNKIIGASLDASILSVQKDKVQVMVQVDGSQDKSTASWFPYSSVYSSPDGTGWYCMPEIGDSVRLYFPSPKESDAYVISSVHLETGTERSDPNKKSIMNKQKKQIEFAPDSLTITNNKGMVIKLDDKEGIFIISDKNIKIEASEEIDIMSQTKSIYVNATESVQLKQGTASITLIDDQIITEGGEVKIQ